MQSRGQSRLSRRAPRKRLNVAVNSNMNAYYELTAVGHLYNNVNYPILQQHPRVPNANTLRKIHSTARIRIFVLIPDELDNLIIGILSQGSPRGKQELYTDSIPKKENDFTNLIEQNDAVRKFCQDVPYWVIADRTDQLGSWVCDAWRTMGSFR